MTNQPESKKTTKPNVLYHYTCKYNIIAITKSRYLTLTESNFSLQNPNMHRVVWLTDSPTPDGMGLLFDANMPDDLNKTHIRFTIRRKPYMKQWDEWSEAKGMEKEQKEVMIVSANAESTYKSWYVSESIIPINDVLVIENIATGEILYQARRANEI